MRKDQRWSRGAQMGALGYAAMAAPRDHRGASSPSGRARVGASAMGGRPAGRPGAWTAHRGSEDAPYMGGPGAARRAPRKSNAAARRRLIMTVLLSALALPVLVGLATGSTVAWWAAVLILPLVGAYTAVVMRAQRALAEKEFSLAFLGGTQLAAPGLEEIFTAGASSTADDEYASGSAGGLGRPRRSSVGAAR